MARCLAESKNSIIKSSLIKLVQTIYPVDMSSASKQNFSCFDDFFTRDFHNTARRIAEAQLVNPVDGCISDFGALSDHHSIVVKHKKYSHADLASSDFMGQDYSFVSYYLAPYNHHQIYMPANGTIVKTVYIPGLLHSVKTNGHKSKDIVNFKNERLVLFIESDTGPMALVLVGALLVGSISTAWGRRYKPSKSMDIVTEENLTYKFAKGDSIARFHYGSSVILITNLKLGKINALQDCKMGEPIWS